MQYRSCQVYNRRFLRKINPFAFMQEDGEEIFSHISGVKILVLRVKRGGNSKVRIAKIQIR